MPGLTSPVLKRCTPCRYLWTVPKRLMRSISVGASFGKVGSSRPLSICTTVRPPAVGEQSQSGRYLEGKTILDGESEIAERVASLVPLTIDKECRCATHAAAHAP